ncbi:dihydroxy-acid dehydratase, partial [Streptomyces longwoodensis]
MAHSSSPRAGPTWLAGPHSCPGYPRSPRARPRTGARAGEGSHVLPEHTAARHRACSPEAASGGTIALVEDGDRIRIDIPGRTIE